VPIPQAAVFVRLSKKAYEDVPLEELPFRTLREKNGYLRKNGCDP